jgi:gelsolin
VVLKLNEKAWDIHYWHGVDCTSDEMGSSAALSVQLSEHLKLGSRHHLELMNEETDLFAGYWKAGLQYLKGGVESGFKHVEPDKYEPRLLLVKGKRHPRVSNVPISGDSLNEGDCFVLDLGMELYYWAGTDANNHEKYKALEIAVAIKNDERKNKAKLFHPRDEGGVAEAKFWEALGGKPASIKPAVPDEEMSNATEAELTKYALFHLSDASGTMTTTEITERPLTRAHLKDDDTYILELYDQVYVWQGKGASPKEKFTGIKMAKDFIKEKNKPKGTKVTRLPQFVEDARFKSYFDGFYPMLKEEFGKDKGFIDTSTSENQDMGKVATTQAKAAQIMLDKLGANYTKTVYFLEDNKTPIKIEDPEEEGKFFAESSYVVDLQSNTHRYQLCWQGKKLTSEENSHTLEAMEVISNHINTSDMTRIRVRKGHEDESFLKFFPSGFVILDEARIPMAEWNAKMADKGVMLRV